MRQDTNVIREETELMPNAISSLAWPRQRRTRSGVVDDYWIGTWTDIHVSDVTKGTICGSCGSKFWNPPTSASHGPLK